MHRLPTRKVGATVPGRWVPRTQRSLQLRGLCPQDSALEEAKGKNAIEKEKNIVEVDTNVSPNFLEKSKLKILAKDFTY